MGHPVPNVYKIKMHFLILKAKQNLQNCLKNKIYIFELSKFFFTYAFILCLMIKVCDTFMPLEKQISWILTYITLNCSHILKVKFSLFSYYFIWQDRIWILFCNCFLLCVFLLNICRIFDVFKTTKSPWSTSVRCLRLHDPGVQIRATMIQLRVVYLLHFLRTINILYF